MAITLIGYRGSGKSSVAPRLAERLGWDWIDADAELELRAGRTIREIFASDGEPEFRRLEHEVIADLAQNPKLVIAAGGGAILREDNRAILMASGPVVWLQADIETLLGRIQGDATTAARRPNLTAAGGRSEVEQLLAIREPLYRQTASFTVDSGNRPVEEIVGDIMKRLQRLGIELEGDRS